MDFANITGRPLANADLVSGMVFQLKRDVEANTAMPRSMQEAAIGVLDALQALSEASDDEALGRQSMRVDNFITRIVGFSGQVAAGDSKLSGQGDGIFFSSAKGEAQSPFDRFKSFAERDGRSTAGFSPTGNIVEGFLETMGITDEEAIEGINAILSGGIETPDELSDLIVLMAVLGIRISMPLLDKVGEYVADYLETQVNRAGSVKEAESLVATIVAAFGEALGGTGVDTDELIRSRFSQVGVTPLDGGAVDDAVSVETSSAFDQPDEEDLSEIPEDDAPPVLPEDEEFDDVQKYAQSREGRTVRVDTIHASNKVEKASKMDTDVDSQGSEEKRRALRQFAARLIHSIMVDQEGSPGRRAIESVRDASQHYAKDAAFDVLNAAKTLGLDIDVN